MAPSPSPHQVRTYHARPIDLPQITSLHHRVQLSLQRLNQSQQLAPVPDAYVSDAIAASRCYVLVMSSEQPSHPSPHRPGPFPPSPSPPDPPYTIIGRAILKPQLPPDALAQIYPRIHEVPDVHASLQKVIAASGFSFLHSVMIDPECQGRGYGALFMQDIVRMVKGEDGVDGSEAVERKRIGTMVLDCWAGNPKLRQFYSALQGWEFVGEVPEETWELSVFCFQLS